MTSPHHGEGRVKSGIPGFLWPNFVPFSYYYSTILWAFPPSKYPLIISLYKSIFLHFALSTFLLNDNEKYPCNLFFCQMCLQTPDLTFWKIIYLIYTHLGQCPLILFLSPCNSFFIARGEDNTLCPLSGIIVLKPSLKQK